MAKTMVRFYVDDQRDADLLTWLEGQAGGRRSEMIRQALRAGLKAGADAAPSAMDAEVLRRVLREELARVAVGAVVRDAALPAAEDDELRGAMDDLLNTWSFETGEAQGNGSVSGTGQEVS